MHKKLQTSLKPKHSKSVLRLVRTMPSASIAAGRSTRQVSSAITLVALVNSIAQRHGNTMKCWDDVKFIGDFSEEETELLQDYVSELVDMALDIDNDITIGMPTCCECVGFEPKMVDSNTVNIDGCFWDMNKQTVSRLSSSQEWHANNVNV